MGPSTGKPDGRAVILNNAEPTDMHNSSTVARGTDTQQVHLTYMTGNSRANQALGALVSGGFSSNRLILVSGNKKVWKQRAGDVNYVHLKKSDRQKVIVKA